MSDPRPPIQKLCKKVPGNKGRFETVLTIEIFPARYFSDKFGPRATMRYACEFYRLESTPYTWVSVGIKNSSDADDFYRFRVNGKWYSEEGRQYEFWEIKKAYQLLEEL